MNPDFSPVFSGMDCEPQTEDDSRKTSPKSQNRSGLPNLPSPRVPWMASTANSHTHPTTAHGWQSRRLDLRPCTRFCSGDQITSWPRRKPEIMTVIAAYVAYCPLQSDPLVQLVSHGGGSIGVWTQSWKEKEKRKNKRLSRIRFRQRGQKVILLASTCHQSEERHASGASPVISKGLLAC